MVDFKKALENYRETLTPAQRERADKYNQLTEENTYYVTNTMLDDDYWLVKRNKERNEYEQEVKLYRPVYRSEELTVADKILLSFGGYREYTFDGQFVKSILRKLKENSENRFCIDAGNEVYVKNSEMLRIIVECVSKMHELGLELVDDYYPAFRNSDMGKMIQGLGSLEF